MNDPADRVASLLQQAAETHHIVYADTDGEDADWATFYSDWLLSHSRLGDVLGRKPVRSHLTAELVSLDERFTRMRSSSGGRTSTRRACSSASRRETTFRGA